VAPGVQQLGAGAQHVGAGAQHEDLLRQQRACAISEHKANPAEQTSVAAANLNMITLLVDRHDTLTNLDFNFLYDSTIL
jgi:hypothetical protein